MTTDFPRDVSIPGPLLYLGEVEVVTGTYRVELHFTPKPDSDTGATIDIQLHKTDGMDAELERWLT